MEIDSGRPAALDEAAGKQTEVAVTRIAYHGWPDCFLVANGSVEAVVAPAIGRVLQLRRTGEREGAFWENRALDGQLHGAVSHAWMNFGGDKCWPAPQTSWKAQQGSAWPPPPGFDALPFEAAADERGVTITSAVDPEFGIQVVRHVELEPGRPAMRIRTEFRKLRGRAVKVGIWTITQMREPERISILLPAKSKFAMGYVRLLNAEPAGLEFDGPLLTLRRHPREFVKIGSEARSLAWEGPQWVVRIEAENKPGEYPDGGCVTEVYTNPDPLKYVELETLGPLATMNVGDRAEQTTVYTVSDGRTSANAGVENAGVEGSCF
jgi:hypothetical protein